MYGHIGLTRWPFPVVPEREYCTFVADRAALRHDLEPLMRNLIRQSTSTIHLIWSWFGAGKTHTLYYIANKSIDATKEGAALLIPVVTEFPRGARSFLDVYKSFAVEIDPEAVTDAYLEVVTSPAADDLRRKLHAASPDLMTALHVMATGDATASSTGLRWLRGDNLTAQTFRAAGITQKISSSEDAIRILAALNRLFEAASTLRNQRAYRIIWMVDEFQRIERLPASLRGDINTGLHSVFNACPRGFSLFLSFSGRPRHELPDWFGPELRDRIGRTKVMVLPPMSKTDGMRFVQDVLASFRRLESYGCQPYFPYSEEACVAILEEVEKSEELKPRAIMQAFGAVLQEAEPLIERNEISEISAIFARKVLKEYVTLALREDTES